MLGLIQAHRPVDATEAQHRDAMLALAAEPRSRHRDHYEPGHFTASAFILSPDDQDLLLIHHGKLHRWLQPGGHVDPTDADLRAAALREALEETGIQVLHPIGDVFDLDVHPIPARKTEPAHAHYDVRFLFRAGNRAFAAGSDARDARWVPRADIPAVHTDESVWRAVRKLDALIPL